MIIQLFDWEGVMLGTAQSWIWPGGERCGLLRNLTVEDRLRDRMEVMGYDQAPVRVRIQRPREEQMEVAGRIEEVWGPEQVVLRGQVTWRYDEVLIAVTGSLD